MFAFGKCSAPFARCPRSTERSHQLDCQTNLLPPTSYGMAFPHKKALLVGATSGIGHTLAARLVKEGCQVVVSGRRQERLDEFVKTHGSASASAMKVDLSDLDTLPGFAAR